MGVLPLDERTITVDGQRWQLDANTTTDDMTRSDGTMQILVRPKGSQKWTHCCHAPLKGSSSNFIVRFIDAFAADRDFREACERLEDGSRIDRETDFGDRAPKPPAAPAFRAGREVARLLKMGGRAKFKDYASLRSGRDAFSSMKEDGLRSLLGEGAAEADKLASERGDPLDPAELVKVLRWMARGLPADMALRKVLTDLEVSKNSRRRT